MKESAEAYLGHTVNKAVITVPAYFNDAQRQATKDAGQIAGLEVARIINEPTAASLAYGLDKKAQEKICVFDLGGGTFDVSILEVADGVFRVISTNGDTHLGGDDFDEALINHVADEFKKEQGIDLRTDQMALQRLQEACEKAKKELSSAQATDINLPFITADSSGPKHLQMNITRAQFEQLVDGLVERVKGPVKKALEDAKLNPSEIDEVVLVGGSTRIPKVQEAVKEIFGKDPHKGVNPDEVVAVGAAIQGGVLSGEVQDILLLGRHSAVAGHRNPWWRDDQAGGAQHHDPHRAEAGVQHRRRQPNRRHRACVPRRARNVRRQPTAGPVQPGRHPPAPRGVPQIEVKFDIDANGILNVSAKDLGTGTEQSVKIEQSSGLSEEEIDRMQKDASEHAEEDKKKRTLIEARNEAESRCYQLEKLIKEQGESLSESDKSSLEAAITKVREAAKGEDADAIKSAIGELETASHAMSEALYKSASAAGGDAAAAGEAPAEAPSDESSDDDAIDAEFEVKS